MDGCGQQRTGEEVKELEGANSFRPHRLAVSNMVAAGHM